jgi:Transposase IS116/IS110/IS902 family
VVTVHDALAAPQLAAPAPIEAAYREVVTALVAMLCCLNEQVAALEQRLASRFAAHPDAVIVRSLPGLGVVLGARVLGEFGDDSARYQTAKGRKAFAGTAPVTRSSGLRAVVVARAACNQRLVDACYLWAFTAMTPIGSGGQPPSGAAGAGESAGRDPARLPGPSGRLGAGLPRGQARWDGRTRRLLDQDGRRRRHCPAGEFGRMP